VLELLDVHASYGKIRTLHGISFSAPTGKITSILGANGAGKTTTMRVITGLLPATGTVLFEGKPLLGLRPDKIVRLGISMVPEKRELFIEMSVAENLRLGAYTRADEQEVRRDIENVLELFPRLRERYGQIAATLSGGEQQMLTIGRALMTNPDLILIDEATEGLAPMIAQTIWQTLGTIRDQGIAAIVVDKDFRALSALADRVLLMTKGELVFTGTPAELKAQGELLEKHLGV
jgi:branched-chain amino acid transport system ATP-binding protein